MSQFKPGDKVVCINTDSEWARKKLQRGGKYRVIEVSKTSPGNITISPLFGSMKDAMTQLYTYAYRFELAPPNKRKMPNDI